MKSIIYYSISLEHNQDLWMSDQDILLQDRIEFLASYTETMFKEELFNLGTFSIYKIKYHF